MRVHPAIVSVVLLGSLFVGCTSDDEDEPDLLSKSELEDVLFSTESLAPGFEVTEDEDDEEDSEFGCLGEAEDLEGEEEKVEVTFGFDSPSEFPTVSNAVLAYSSAQDLEEELDGLVHQLEDCTEINEVDGGANIELELDLNTDVSVDADQQVNLVASGTISAEGQSFPFGMAVTAARVDNYMVGVQFATFGEVTDDSVAQRLLSASVERLRAALDDESLPSEEPLLEDLVGAGS